MKFLALIALPILFVLAESQAEVEKKEEGCRPCGIVPRPGRRPCCPSSSDLPAPPVPEPCGCCPPPPSDYWCPCDCPESSTTVCPPPPVPVPPCPVVCCESSSSVCSSSTSSVCQYRRVPVPRPFVKPRVKPCSSSSSEHCCCPQKPRCHHRRHHDRKPRGCGCGPKAANSEGEDDLEEEVEIAIQNEADPEDVLVLNADDLDILEQQAIEAGQAIFDGAQEKYCPRPTCEKKKALQIVFQLDRRFVKLVNEQNLPDLYNMITDHSRYAMITPQADSPTCTRVVGPLAQFLPNYIGYTLTTVFQDIAYNKDGSVTIHVLDVLTQGSTTIIAEDVWRTYRASSGCLYKIDYLNGVNWLCK